MRRTAFAAASFLLLVAGCQPSGPPEGVSVINAWARLPAVPDRPAAAYFTLRNSGPAAAVTAVQSPQVQRIELHDSQMHGGMMHMAPMAEVELPQGGSVYFKPGGKHAMLFGVDPKLAAGGMIALSFTLRDGRKVEGQAQLVGAGASSPYAP